MKYLRILNILAGSLIFTACSEQLLDLYPKTAITEASFYRTQDEFILAGNEVYRKMAQQYEAGGIADIYGELRSDNTEIILISGGDNSSERISDFNMQTNDQNTEKAWFSAYNSIFVSNDLLLRLEKTDVEFKMGIKERLIGEATFVRALTYFNMVRVWGDVPFMLKPITPEEAYDLQRENKSVIYGQILKDLVYAKEVLPREYLGNEVGRITKFAASAVLAKVYLTLGKTTEAESELKQIIGSGIYSLDANNDGKVDAEDYKFLFQPDTKNCKSSILEIQYKSGENAVNSNHQLFYTPFDFSFHLPESTETFRGLGRNTPTLDLRKEFESADSVRMGISIVPGFVNLSTGTFVQYPFTMKFYDPNWRYPGQNFEVIRFSDILLMYSEVTGDPQYLNQVRDRAGVPLFGQPGYPGEYSSLQQAIEHERRVELCFENHRFFDLVRTGRAIPVMKEKGYNINENSLLFPVPQRAIDVNSKLKQNPGYN